MASPPSSGSPRARWRSTCAASWPSCGCRRRRTITAACWRCSPTWTRAEQVVDRGAREHGLRDEARRRAGFQQLLEIRLAVGGDEDDLRDFREQRACDVHAVLRPEI